MSDPRNVAHDKKVAQEKKHHGAEATPEDAAAVQPGKKPAVAKKHDPAEAGAGDEGSGTGEAGEPAETPAPAPVPAALEASLVVLAKLKEMEFHSRANVERLAELTMTIEDELKQKAHVGAIGEVYSAQSAFQTKITDLIQAYQAECDAMQAARG